MTRLRFSTGDQTEVFYWSTSTRLRFSTGRRPGQRSTPVDAVDVHFTDVFITPRCNRLRLLGAPGHVNGKIPYCDLMLVYLGDAYSTLFYFKFHDVTLSLKSQN